VVVEISSVSTTENLSPTAHKNNHPEGVCSTLCLTHKEKTALATAKGVCAATFFSTPFVCGAALTVAGVAADIAAAAAGFAVDKL
jgi:hypothetical protein